VIRWADAPPSAIGPAWSLWPAPNVATLKRSNVWAAPIIHAVTWMPPSVVHLAPPDVIVDAPPTWWHRLGNRVSGFFRRSR
jgi:hypothetical protein